MRKFLKFCELLRVIVLFGLLMSQEVDVYTPGHEETFGATRLSVKSHETIKKILATKLL